MVKEYFLKNGEKRYKFSVYLGTDALGKQKFTNRSGFKTKREATIEKRRLSNSINPDTTLKSQEMTFNELYDMWFESYKTTVRPSTYISVERLFKFILKDFGNLKIQKITTAYCQKIFIEWSKTHKSYKGYVKRTKALLKYAKGLKLINDNPADYVVLPRNETLKVEADLYFTKEELIKFLNGTQKIENKIYYPIFRLLAFTGIRIGEALALTWKDINFLDKTISISKTLTKGKDKKLAIGAPKTKNSHRTIYVDDVTLQALNSWRVDQKKLLFKSSARNNLNLVFTYTGKFLHKDPFNYMATRICKTCNIKTITLHGFRHTHCSLLFESGADIKEIQARLGHSTIQTTLNIYTHINQKRTKETTDKFVKYVNF